MRGRAAGLVAVLLAATLARWLPLPPPPAPPDPQAAIRAAPMPNQDMRGPTLAPSAGPEIAPRMFRGNDTRIGQGFLPGSEFRNDEDRRIITTPGFSVRVPIQ